MWVIDGALLESAVSGDRIAIDSLLGLLYPGVLRFCRSRLGERRHRDCDAEDCAQEVLLGVLGALPGYRYGAGKFPGFVYGIAVHKVVDARRRRHNDVSVPVPEFPSTPSAQPEPLRHVEDVERRQRLHGLLGLLACWPRTSATSWSCGSGSACPPGTRRACSASRVRARCG